MSTALRTLAAALFSAIALLYPASAEEAPTPPATPAPPEILPPKPASHILDDLHVLRPEMTADLSARLTATAREKDVHIYLITVARHTHAQLEELGDRLTRTWTKDLIGAIIAFDDDSGEMTIATSKRLDSEFSSVQFQMLFRDRLLASSRAYQLSRDKLFEAATLLASGVGDMKATAERVAHRGLISNLIMSGLALVGIGLAVFSALDKPKTAAASDSKPTVKDHPPVDF